MILNNDLKIIVHRLEERRNIQIFSEIVTIDESVRPIWCRGILMVLYAFRDSDDIIRERLNGVIHYEEVDIVSCPKYIQTIKNWLGQEVPVLDLTGDSVVEDIVAYILERAKN